MMRTCWHDRPDRRLRGGPAVAILLSLVLLLTACSRGGGGGGGFKGVRGTVRNPAGEPVSGATVYLIPAGRIDLTPITGESVLSGAARAHDEPLEDLVRSGAAEEFPKGVTDAEGRYRVSRVPRGDSFLFVQPAAADTEHLPGGSRSRRAVPADSLAGTTVNLSVSSSPPAEASHIGSTACLQCHPGHRGATQSAHYFPLRRPGQPSPLQDTSRYPDIDSGLAHFRSASAYTGGTVLWYADYDGTRGADKFIVSMSDPRPGGATLYLKVYLWRDSATGERKVTMENVINSMDPLSPRTFLVRLVHGGALFKQRYLLQVPGWPTTGLYPFLQFHPEGNEGFYDRTRKVFTDYRMDSFWAPATNALRDPPGSRVWQGNCGSCHFTGFRTWLDPVRNEWLADAVNDSGGAYDIDGDLELDEVGVGCEACHGPGSVHAVARAGKFIVSPDRLSPERAAMVCGRCHDRPEGNGTVRNEQPLNAANEFPRPGIGREEWLAQYTSRPGPATGNFWPDLVHSRNHHQQYSDLLKSVHSRNRSILVTCDDCHSPHGEGRWRWGLRGDPDDPRSPLCQACHLVDPLPHMQEETGSHHAGVQTSCPLCHMPETAKNGSGHYGYLLGRPTGNPSTDPDLVYWMNDITSHVFDMPVKFSRGVRGVRPGSAMPVPYTHRCGTCHDPSGLPWLPPDAPR